MTKSRSRSRRFSLQAAALVGVTALGLSACASSGDANESSSSGQSIEFNVVSWATPGSLTEVMGDWWYGEVESRSNGRMTFNIAAGDTLCSASEIPECVRDGRADIGQSLTDYSTQLFPMASVVSIPFLSTDGAAVSKALFDLSGEHEGAAALWEQNNLKPLSHVPPGRLLIGSYDEVTSIDDLSGLRMRMAGRFAQHAVDAAGASSVAIPAPETYEALERGLADIAGFPLEGTAAFQLRDVLPEWTDPGLGMYTTIGMWMNYDVYDGLDDDLRQIIDEVNAEFNDTVSSDIFTEVSNQQCDELIDTVGDLKQWAPAETQRWRDVVAVNLESLWVEEAENDGLTGAADYLDRYKEKLEEYTDPSRPDSTIACAERN